MQKRFTEEEENEIKIYDLLYSFNIICFFNLRK